MGSPVIGLISGLSAVRALVRRIDLLRENAMFAESGYSLWVPRMIDDDISAEAPTPLGLSAAWCRQRREAVREAKGLRDAVRCCSAMGFGPELVMLF
jgi:hypothetical protein